MCNLLHIDKTRTTPYHPQSDGRVERLNRTLISSLRAYAHDTPGDWDGKLPLVLLSYRSAVHASTGFTPSKMLTGSELRLPVDLVFGQPPGETQSSISFVRNLQSTLTDVHHRARECDAAGHRHQKDIYDRRSKGKPFEVGELVWLFSSVVPSDMPRKLHWPWTGPYRVCRQLDLAVYEISPLSGGRTQNVHFNRLKRCVSSTTDSLPASSSALPASCSHADEATVLVEGDDDPVLPPPPPQPPPLAGPRAHLARTRQVPPRFHDYIMDF